MNFLNILNLLRAKIETNQVKPEARVHRSAVLTWECSHSNDFFLHTSKILQGGLFLSLVSLSSPPLNLILRFNHYQRKTDAKAISVPQIFRMTSHWLAGADLSEGLSSTVPEKAPRNPSSHLPP